MVPEISSMPERIFCHFGLLLALLPSPPPNNPENQNFEQIKTTPGDIITLHTRTIHQNHMYDS